MQVDEFWQSNEKMPGSDLETERFGDPTVEALQAGDQRDEVAPAGMHRLTSRRTTD